MNFILCSYLVLFCIQILFSLFLELLNYRYIQRNSGTVPDYVKGDLTEEQYQKSVLYSSTKIKFSIVSASIHSVILLFVILGGFLGELDLWVQGLNWNVYAQAVGYISAVSLFFFVIELPFSLYSNFVIEEKFGFNKLTLKLWCLDQIKSLFLSMLIVALVVACLVGFLEFFERHWWIFGFLFIATFQVLMIFVYPIWIAPLFNKFTPLEDLSLKGKIEEVADRAGYKAESIFVMDGSRRSQHANAYFTGFGRAKRIVLYDTLLSMLSHEQLVAVLAHEIGHEKLNHIKKSMIFSFVLMFITFYLINLLMFSPLFFEAFGFSRISYHGALVVFSFASAPVTFWLGPLFSMLSRKHEYEADAFALKTVGSKSGLMTALVQLSKKSLANFTPHPLYSFFHYSHPTLFERLKAMEAGRVD